MKCFYNEISSYHAGWLFNLQQNGVISEGIIERRSITELSPDDVMGYDRVHLFAGIGGWDYALRLAGWPDGWPVWTGSCPCQPFSIAGKGKGVKDERHLWPEMFRLVRECKPPVIFGEQVASNDALGWLDGVFADLEGAGYTCEAVDLCAAGVNSPHSRQRLFWVAHTERWSAERYRYEMDGSSRGNQSRTEERQWIRTDLGNGDPVGGLADPQFQSPRRDRFSGSDAATRDEATNRSGDDQLTRHRSTIGMANGNYTGQCAGEGTVQSNQRDNAGWCSDAVGVGNPDSERLQGRTSARCSNGLSPWEASLVCEFLDGKKRRIGTGISPLAYGIPARRSDPRLGYLLAKLGELGFSPEDTQRVLREARNNRRERIKGYGNAIVPQVAAMFVRAFMESVGGVG